MRAHRAKLVDGVAAQLGRGLRFGQSEQSRSIAGNHEAPHDFTLDRGIR